MNKRFRVYTESLGYENDGNLIKRFGEVTPCFTVGTMGGVWNGAYEESLIFEVVIDPETNEGFTNRLLEFCKYVCVANNQDAVMITEEDVSMCLVSAEPHFN